MLTREEIPAHIGKLVALDVQPERPFKLTGYRETLRGYVVLGTMRMGNDSVGYCTAEVSVAPDRVYLLSDLE
jgi:hypothetical protein